MTQKTNWQPNEKQKRFLEILKNHPEGISLYDVEAKYGEKFATGTINPLKTKGLTMTEEVTYECKILRADNDQVVGKTTKKVSLYKLA